MPKSNRELSQEAFDQYMLASLQRSSEFTHRLKQESYSSIQLFLTLLTGLAGGIIVIFTTVDDDFLKFSLMGIIFLFAAGFGTLTYLWLLSSYAYAIGEQTLRFFLEKYFRDLNPEAFDKYGMTILLLPYSQFQEKGFFSPARRTSFLSLYILAFFASLLMTSAGFMGSWAITGSWNLLFPILLGILWFIILIAIERFYDRRVKQKSKRAYEIFTNHHLELPTEKDSNNQTATHR